MSKPTISEAAEALRNKLIDFADGLNPPVLLNYADVIELYGILRGAAAALDSANSEIPNNPALDQQGDPCRTCNGEGMVGGNMGQTAESFSQESLPCPDCQQGEGREAVPFCWLRMRPDGEPDWAEDCFGIDEHFLDHEMKSDGFWLKPLYTNPQPTAAREAPGLYEASRALVGIVEGIQSQGRNWTSGGQRIKDTPEWVRFYLAAHPDNNASKQPTATEHPAPVAVDLEQFRKPVQFFHAMGKLGEIALEFPFKFLRDEASYSAQVEEADRLLAMIDGQRPPAPAVPEGWVLVPREPTETMKKVGAGRLAEASDVAWTAKGEQEAARCAYAAMLAAAPQPPSAPDYPITARCRVCDIDYRCAPVPAKCAECGADLPPSNGEVVGEVFGPKETSTMVALNRALPPGTKLYTAPPSAPVGVADAAFRAELIRMGWTPPEGRGAVQPAPVPAYFVEACDKTDWTPQEALEFYADGKHFDTDRGLTRILDTGVIASYALKNSSPEYWSAKGGDAIGPQPAPVVPDDARDAARWRALRDADPDAGEPYIAINREDEEGDIHTEHLHSLDAENEVDAAMLAAAQQGEK